MKNSLLKRLFLYQRERFPVIVIAITSLSVLLSSAAVVIPSEQLISQSLPAIFLGILTSIFFMFHLRVIDEYRDLEFDSKHHKDRPIQKGTITLKELLTLNVILLMTQFLLNLFYQTNSSIIWMIAFGFTIISGNDFFMKNKIRKKFILYNLLNMVSLLIFQFYLYSLFNPEFSIINSLLLIHFVFAILNVSMLEYARKIKCSKQESTGKDTYSSRFGKKNSILAFTLIILVTYSLFAYTYLDIYSANLKFISSLLLIILIVTSLIHYLIKDKKSSEILIQSFSVIFYITTHLLLALPKI